MNHWAINYIGKPWEYGAQGPDTFDCWGFTRFVQFEHFNIELPFISVPKDWMESKYEIEHNAERALWVKVETPIEGDIVLMARNKVPVHIGITIFANNKLGVLHCAQGCGVVFQDPIGLRSAGWGGLTYYRRNT